MITKNFFHKSTVCDPESWWMSITTLVSNVMYERWSRLTSIQAIWVATQTAISRSCLLTGMKCHCSEKLFLSANLDCFNNHHQQKLKTKSKIKKGIDQPWIEVSQLIQRIRLQIRKLDKTKNKKQKTKKKTKKKKKNKYSTNVLLKR